MLFLMFGQRVASTSKILRVILRQELPPKPSARATLSGFVPQNLLIGWMSFWVPLMPTFQPAGTTFESLAPAPPDLPPPPPVLPPPPPEFAREEPVEHPARITIAAAPIAVAASLPLLYIDFLRF